MRLAFVDLETTGGSPFEDRITEVGIIEVDLDADGPGRKRWRPVREWSALVNPDAPIPPFIETLTGITNAMVAGAPRFEELADDIRARLDGRLFIAHNARFDHGFLKNAFRRLGHPFRPSVLCTVRLSRKLYPGYSRHNLDALIERHRLDVDMRHRALGDARLLWQLWQRFHDALPAEQIVQAIDQLTARPSLPRHLDPDVLDTLPKTAGVYLFLGQPQETVAAAPGAVLPAMKAAAAEIAEAIDSTASRSIDQATDSTPATSIDPATGSTTRTIDESPTRSPSSHPPPRSTDAASARTPAEPHPLYIGKARNLRQRVMAHFTGDHLSAREMEISQQMTRIDWIETGGGTQLDLGALLTEATLVKARMPTYNRQLRRSEDVCAWRLVVEREPTRPARASKPAWRLALARPDDLFFAQDPDLFGPFATPRQAGVTLRAIADAHGLCPVLLKLDRGTPGKPCFAHQVKRCLGACIGLETPDQHTDRLKAALASLAMKPWPFAGPAMFREGRCLHVVDGWAYLGMTTDADGARRLAIQQRPFDHDVYRLLASRIDRVEFVPLD